MTKVAFRWHQTVTTTVGRFQLLKNVLSTVEGQLKLVFQSE